MADINITQLTSYADPKSTDELPIVDLVADVTKRVTLAKLLQNAVPGTAAAPGITFDGRAVNTGIYSPDDYQVGIATNGISRILCRENGYVGINKASPTAPFDVVGNSVITGTLNVTGNTALGADLTVTGNLTVNGTTTTVNSTTVTIDDKNIELGSVAAPTNTTADGGGITLRGATDKTWNWVNSTSSWTSSEHIDLASGKVYKINGTEVLSATALASAVQITSANITNGTIVNEDISASAKIAVSKLADGTARQLLQTDAAGTGVEWASNIDVPGTLDVTGATTLASAAVSDLTEDRVVIAGASGELEDSANLTFDGSELTVGGDLTVVGNLTVEGTATTIESTTLTVEDKNIELAVVDTPDDTTADGGGITLKGDTDKTINWVDATDAWTFSEHVDLASAKEFRIAGTKVLDATSLGSAVVSSSLTSVGTIATGTWEGDAIDAAYLDPTVVTTDDTGTVTSTMISDGTIVDGDINASAAIADTKLDTISTAGKVSNSATTATDANTANAIVARDASGDFTAGTITADLAGNADTATALETARDIGGVSFDGTADINLPGVNTTGNQDTSGNAATATKLDSSRTFEVTGDVTGTVSSDLTSGASIATSIASGVIVDADVNASAAIAGTKINPDFGSQTVTTAGVDLADAGDITVGTTTGTKIGTATTQKLGFYNATPVVQPAAVADITTTATAGSLPTPDGSVTIADATTPTVTELLEYCVELEAKLESALAALRTLGLIAT
jgi:hypothetical protein